MSEKVRRDSNIFLGQSGVQGRREKHCCEGEKEKATKPSKIHVAFRSILKIVRLASNARSKIEQKSSASAMADGGDKKKTTPGLTATVPTPSNAIFYTKIYALNADRL